MKFDYKANHCRRPSSVRLALQTFLKTDPEIEIVGVAVTGLEAIQKVSEIIPDVVVKVGWWRRLFGI